MFLARHFFRHHEDAYGFPMFSVWHWMLLLVFILGLVLIAYYGSAKRREEARKRWEDAGASPDLARKLEARPWDNLRRFMFWSLLIKQILIYSWFIMGGVVWRRLGLPFYHCRIAEIAMLFALSGHKGLARSVSIYLGLFGAPLALLVPITERFTFPHISIVTYFMGHGLMLWIVCYLIVVEAYPFDRKDFYRFLAFFNAVNVFICIFDQVTDMNFAYFSEAPVGAEIFALLPKPLYWLFLFAMYNLLVLLLFFVSKMIRDKKRIRI